LNTLIDCRRHDGDSRVFRRGTEKGPKISRQTFEAMSTFAGGRGTDDLCHLPPQKSVLTSKHKNKHKSTSLLLLRITSIAFLFLSFTIVTMPVPTSSSRLNLCHQSSFGADNTMITVVPSFHYSSQLPLLSSPSQQTAGPFVAGMPVEVPLWMSKVLHQRQLAQIRLPEWLQTTKLTEILKEEKRSTLLTTQLPFYYYEIARALAMVLEKSTQIVLQDLVAVRVDKIRQHFHELSRGDLQQNEGELPMIAVTGIASVELNKVGPFLQRAFSDYGYLTQLPQEDKENATTSTGGGGLAGEKESDDAGKKVSMARSRLRRFRS
jgi:hypothetical protein